jgi:predicted dehydrogenase
MVQTHPQWVRAVELVRSGAIGTLRAAYGSFGYYRPEAENIRNIRQYGGGGLMDVGCYPIKTSRLIFGEEPLRVAGALVRDPGFGTDTLASAVLEFPSGHCVFTCATQIALNQSMQFLGTTGRIDFDLPFNPVPNEISRMRVNGDAVEFAPCDQYTIQGDAFARAILEGGQPPVPLEDSVKNMKVIDAVFRAGESGRWEAV